MIPIGDSVRTRSVPYVNIAIIVANFLVFFYELSLSQTGGFLGSFSEVDRFFFEWGAIPACVSDRLGLDPNVRADILQAVCEQSNHTLISPLSSMFIQAGWLHILGNMLFLWIFGDNVEDALGHVRYAFFYLVSGVGASLVHVLVNASDVIPSVGASGAIAGVMGAYLVLYPRASVAVLFPFFFLFWGASVPAVVLIGFWFLMQVFSGVAAIGGEVVGGGGGVAWFAHIGGFLIGLALVTVLRPRQRAVRPIHRPRDLEDPWS